MNIFGHKQDTWKYECIFRRKFSFLLIWTANKKFYLAMKMVKKEQTKAIGIYTSRSIKHELSKKDLDEKS